MSETHSAYSQSQPSQTSLTPWGLWTLTVSSLKVFHQKDPFTKSHRRHTFSPGNLNIIALLFFFSPPFSTPSFSQSSLSISRTEEPPCHPGSCRTQPCGHQCHLCQHGLLRPWSHCYPQEAAKPHGGCALWRSWYRAYLYIDYFYELLFIWG